MKIYIASDHGGFDQKREIIKYFKSKRIKLIDLGPKILRQQDDYSDFAFKLGEKVTQSPKNYGILICRNGIGITMAANKVKGIRAGLCTFIGQAVTAKAHDNCNVLSLAADFVKLEQNIEIIATFLAAKFSKEERHIRRINKIITYENKK